MCETRISRWEITCRAKQGWKIFQFELWISNILKKLYAERSKAKKIMEKLNRAQKCSILGPQNLGSGGARAPGAPPESAPEVILMMLPMLSPLTVCTNLKLNDMRVVPSHVDESFNPIGSKSPCSLPDGIGIPRVYKKWKRVYCKSFYDGCLWEIVF